ncbi:MAG: hypothetical protein OEV49_04125 [candidate division Zixibacteria bacterium]|nr:hypothetical protein [candidate division Zixibacteria bacterium]MDH3936203.1 hypothetical protein [candidate division Zixibacteria bacterium]MDH4033072.1 hypothetical protein [candidate division Zixibacteria bacterium]
MKRFLLIGTLFCTAALFGLGITLFLPSDAYAGICIEAERQAYFDCADAACSPPTPVGVYDCGTWDGGNDPGGPCNCQFIRCQLKCPPPPL